MALGRGRRGSTRAGRLAIEVAAEKDQYERDMKSVRATAKRTGKESADEMEKSSKRIKDGFFSAATAIKAFFAAAALRGFIRISQRLFEIGSAVVETASKYETVFGPAVERVNAFLEENARRMGLTDSEAKGLLATSGAIAQGLGADAEKAAEFATEIQSLAADIGSFNNLPTEDVLQRINSALTGETESLKRLGIVVRQEEVNQRALLNTGKQRAEQLTQLERAQATLTIITEKAGVAVGDLARTQDSAANRARRLQAAFRQLKEDVATAVLPVFESLLSLLAQNEQQLEDASGALDRIGERIKSAMRELAGALSVDAGETFRNIGIIIGAKLGEGILRGMAGTVRGVIAAIDEFLPTDLFTKILDSKINPGLNALDFAADRAAESAAMANEALDELFKGSDIFKADNTPIRQLEKFIAAREEKIAELKAQSERLTKSLETKEKPEDRERISAAIDEKLQEAQVLEERLKTTKALLAELKPPETVTGGGGVGGGSGAGKAALDAEFEALKKLLEKYPDLAELRQRGLDAGPPPADQMAFAVGAAQRQIEAALRSADSFGAKALAISGILASWGIELDDLPEGFQQAIEPFVEGTEDADDKLKDTKRSLSDVVNDVSFAARGAVEFANAFGLADENAARVVNQVALIGEGIGRIASGDILGGIGGVLSGAAGLFGESAAEKALRAALERNARETELLRRDIRLQREVIAKARGEDLEQLQNLFAGLDASAFPEGWPGMEQRIAQIERFFDLMERSGMSIEDVNVMLESMGIAAVEVSEDGKVAYEDLFRVAEALRTLEIADFFAGFEGRLENLRRSFDIKDIDDAAEKIEAYLDLLREFSGLDVPEFDLDSAEGRAALDRWIREVFLGAEGLTLDDLGELSISELLDLLGSIEGLADSFEDALADDFTSRSFQEFRGITEIQASRLEGLLTTDVFWNETTARNVQKLVELAGGAAIGSFPGPLPAPNFDPERFAPREPRGDRVDQSFHAGGISVVVHGAPDMNEDVLASKIVQKVNRELGNAHRRGLRDSGAVTSRSVRG